MRLVDALSLAGGAVLSNGRRTVLTLLGVIIGVAAVVVLTALGEGALRYVTGQFESLGTNMLGVVPGKTETAGAMPGFGGGVPNDLTLADARALERAIQDAVHVAPMVMANDTVSHGARSRQALVVGTTPGFLPIRRLAVARGTYLPDQPWDRGGPVVVLGHDLARELFGAEDPVGGKVRIGAFRMRVIGVLEERGVQLGIDLDEAAHVPVATGMQLFDRSSLFRVLMDMKAGADLDAAEQRVVSLMAERHGEEDVTVITQDAVLGGLTTILGLLTLVLGGIAAVSLTVAGIGVMNVMLVSVSERTDEIGLLKAIGAAPRQVLTLFLAEAVVLSLTGGVLGLALGWGVVGLARVLWPAFPATPPEWAVIAALGTSFLVGVLFGLVPARRAVRLDPVVALTGGH